jgi:DNA-binding CsgD family transcriptional regulator
MTAELAELSTVLDAVYDAALDVALWPLAIERAAGFVRCIAGMVAAYDLMQRGVSFRIPWGYEQKYLDTFDYYASINPMLRSSFAFKAGQVSSIADIMPFEEFRKYPTFTDWAKPQGIGDVVQAVLEKSPMALSVLALSRHEREGPVDAETRRRMALIIPHFRRSVQISKVIDLARIEVATFRNTIDGLAAAVFLVSRDARLIHANTQGAKMLAAGDPLRLADGHIHATGMKAARELAASLDEAASDEVVVQRHGVAVPLVAATGERHVAHVLPMASGGRREAVAGNHATAALFVRRMDQKFPVAIETIARLYKLTDGETRVLHVILEAGSVPATALLLRLTENTVKTHLRHIFAKTGSRNQVDLVKLAAGLASPFVAP